MSKYFTANRVVLALHIVFMIATGVGLFIAGVSHSFPKAWQPDVAVVLGVLSTIAGSTVTVTKFLDGSQKLDQLKSQERIANPVVASGSGTRITLPNVGNTTSNIEGISDPQYVYADFAKAVAQPPQELPGPPEDKPVDSMPDNVLSGSAARPDLLSGIESPGLDKRGRWASIPGQQADTTTPNDEVRLEAIRRMYIDQRGLNFIAGFEGGESSDGLFHAYWDPYGHVWTIGYGETSGVHPGMTWTKAQAEDDLKRKLENDYIWAINNLDVPLTQNQFNALCSFVWNLGAGSMQWDIGRYLRARNYQAAANALLEYTHAGGVVLAGLVRRREAERALFLTPDPHPDPYAIFPTDIPGLGNERGLVQMTDTELKHPANYRASLEHNVYPRLKRFRDRLSRISIYEPPEFTKRRKKADWNTDYRGERWQEINKRMKKIEEL